MPRITVVFAGHDILCVEQEYYGRLCCSCVDHEFVSRQGVCFTEHLSRKSGTQDTFGSPVIYILNYYPAFDDYSKLLGYFASFEYRGVVSVIVFAQDPEIHHGFDIGFRDSFKCHHVEYFRQLILRNFKFHT